MAKRKRKNRAAKIWTTLLSVLVLLCLLVWQYFEGGLDSLFGNQIPSELPGRTDIAATDLQVHYIDVGQADSILIRIPAEGGMKNILVDAGTSETSKPADLEAYLRDVGVETLEYFIITHPDLDHVGAADEVIRDFDVKNIIMADMSPDIAKTSSWLRVLSAMDAKKLEYIPSEAGKTYTVGDASFMILGPVDPELVKDANNYSVVFRLDYGETSFLFTGDAKFESETAMLSKFPSATFHVDVLKVGHHGSATTSTSDEFLAAVSPTYAVISCGAGNSYGHPHQKTLDKLAAAGVNVLRTDLEGTIILCSDQKEVYRPTTK